MIRTKQETGSYCGPAVVQMLVSQYGKEIEQRQIVESCGASETAMKLGIPLKSLVVGIKKLFPDLTIWQKSFSSLGDLERLVNNGYLVAFDWQGIFREDEYKDDVSPSRLEQLKDWFGKIPALKGDQGHYCVALEVNREKGYLRFADPYGHYAGLDRFVALWEFEERWWDDRLDKDESGKTVRVVEERLIFVLTKLGDNFPASLGMEKA